MNLIRVIPAEGTEMRFQYLRQALQPKSSLRWSIIVGNLLEHFDSSLYAFLAPLIGKTFFPNFTPLYQLILTYSVYIITFFARPLGGIFFSNLTYRHGALKPLLWALMGVALVTGSMGLIPGADQIGSVAPFLLMVVRFIQSFCAAGESAIAGYYLIENSSHNKQMMWSGLYQSSTVLGILMASSLSSFILSFPENERLWRFACLLGFGLGSWGLWMRFRYQKKEIAAFFPHNLSYTRVMPRLRAHWKLVLFLIPIYGLSYLTYSFPFVFLNPYLAQITSFPLSSLMQQTSSLLWMDALLLPIIGLLIQRFDCFKALIGSIIIFTVSSCSMMIFLPPTSLWIIFLMRSGMMIGGIGFGTALIPWTAGLYPPRDKYFLHSVSYNSGSELFGRSTPAICLWLYALTRHPSSSLIYVLGLIIIALGLMIWLQLFQSTNELAIKEKSFESIS